MEVEREMGGRTGKDGEGREVLERGAVGAGAGLLTGQLAWIDGYGLGTCGSASRSIVKRRRAAVGGVAEGEVGEAGEGGGEGP